MAARRIDVFVLRMAHSYHMTINEVRNILLAADGDAIVAVRMIATQNYTKMIKSANKR